MFDNPTFLEEITQLSLNRYNKYSILVTNV
jgi:hypothetical protein